MKWISVKDKLLPMDVPILVTNGQERTLCVLDEWKDGSGEIRHSMYGYGFGGYEWEFEFNYEDITHWMPLPEPPKTQAKK